MKKLISYQVLVSVIVLTVVFVIGYSDFGATTTADTVAAVFVVAAFATAVATVAAAVVVTAAAAVVAAVVTTTTTATTGIIIVATAAGFVVGVVGVEYAENNNILKRYVLGSLAVEFIIIAVPIAIFFH